MLDEKLEKAKLENTKKRQQLFFGAIGIIVLVVVSWFCFLGVKQFLENRPSPAVSSQQNNQSKDIEVSKASTDTDSMQVDKEEFRAQFKEILNSFESEIEPQLPAGNGWMNEELFDIDALKKESLGQFASGDYVEAIKRLEQLQTLASSVIQQTDQAFQDELAKAQSFYSKDLYEEAKLHIEKALHVKPQQQDALALQQEIEILPQLLPLLNGVKVAQTENDLLKEYNLLKEIKQLSPDRSGIAERIVELEGLLKEQAFALHIEAGFDDVEKGKVTSARTHYREAKNIDPNRQELNVLAKQLTALEKRIRVKNNLQKAENAIRRDDWQAAYTFLTNAAKDVPQDNKVQEGLTQAKTIINLKQEFKKYLADPYRLSDSGIAGAAKQLRKKAEPFEQYSFSLQLQNRELSKMIKKMQRLIAVTVKSDQKTFVQVRGIGKVGTVTEKTIQLKPGRYTFEGSRDGYITKFIKVLIPHDNPSFQVHVICDQPI